MSKLLNVVVFAVVSVVVGIPFGCFAHWLDPQPHMSYLSSSIMGPICVAATLLFFIVIGTNK